MKIGGKSISIKMLLIIAGVVAFIVLLIVANQYQANKEASLEETVAQETDVDGNPVTEAVLSDAEAEQLGYIKSWGEPPVGFRWDDDKQLIPISDESLTAEQVAYQYLRSLTLLDIATVEKYSNNSKVVSQYNSYYNTEEEASYYEQFQRKLFKEAIVSMEVEEAVNSAIFANGRTIITFNVTLYDLTNKDFWKSDSNKIFNDLYVFNTTEDDSTKAEQYVYDRILKYFQSGDASKRTIQVELVLDKVTLGGWLVSDDSDILMACEYKEGTSVYQYIMSCYEEWVEDKDSI